jgi:hypothetical protein
MVTVPAEKMFDQLTLYVRISPGWNAWIPAGGGVIVCSAAADAETPTKSPAMRKQNTTDVRKKRLDPIFRGSAIDSIINYLQVLHSARTKPEDCACTYIIEYFSDRLFFIT